MRRILILSALLCISADAAPQDWTAYINLTTDYVKRGVSQSDSHGAAQLGGEVAFDSGIYAGAWGSTADIDNGPNRHRDKEVNLYAGYGRDISPKLRLSAYIVSYNYPGQTGAIDYDYVEYTLSSNYDDRLWLEYSYSPDLYNTGFSTSNIEAIAELPLHDELRMSAGIGHYDTSRLTGATYTYWQLGITRALRWADIDLRYHDTDRDVFIISTPDRAEARLVLSLMMAF